MVRLLFVSNGRRGEMIVPLTQARRANKRLFEAGAAVYWSERC